MPELNEGSFYPELTEDGKAEAQKIMDSFKVKLVEIMEGVLSDLYTDVSYHIESDHWTNYKNHIIEGLQNYSNNDIYHDHDFKIIRQAIYRNHKDEIIRDLNQDLIKENEELKFRIERLYKNLTGSY